MGISMNDNNFYTLNGYRKLEPKLLTESMEDYLEMSYREYLDNGIIKINSLANKLNVKPSSVSKMMNKLKDIGYVEFEKYRDIKLTELGIITGQYLLWRHNILSSFFKYLNKEDYKLEQVEKVEHFLDISTLIHLEELLNKKRYD